MVRTLIVHTGTVFRTIGLERWGTDPRCNIFPSILDMWHAKRGVKNRYLRVVQLLVLFETFYISDYIINYGVKSCLSRRCLLRTMSVYVLIFHIYIIVVYDCLQFERLEITLNALFAEI